MDRTTTTKSISQILLNRLNNGKQYVEVYTHTQELEIAIEAISNNSKSSIYALLYNALDEQNHHSNSFTDDESVEGHLKLIARLANQSFQQCIKQGLNPKLLVISDHGSTLLPTECPVKKIPNFALEFNDDALGEYEGVNERKSPYQGTRSCAIDKTSLSDDIAEIKQDWYYLTKDSYNLPQDFLIPKSYAAVNRRPSGWTHGGATPEETVVAFIEVQPKPIQIIQPSIKIDGYLKPNQASSLSVVVENPNTVNLKIVRLRISDAPKDIMCNSLLMPFQDSVEQVNFIPANHQGKTQIIEWLLSCEAGGQNWQFSGQIEIPIRRFQVSLVDELFNM